MDGTGCQVVARLVRWFVTTRGTGLDIPHPTRTARTHAAALCATSLGLGVRGTMFGFYHRTPVGWSVTTITQHCTLQQRTALPPRTTQRPLPPTPARAFLHTTPARTRAAAAATTCRFLLAKRGFTHTHTQHSPTPVSCRSHTHPATATLCPTAVAVKRR